jgi:hypothetical protein
LPGKEYLNDVGMTESRDRPRLIQKLRGHNCVAGQVGLQTFKAT